MPLTFQTVFPVRSYECDYYGHVNQANYLRYMQEAAYSASASVGYDEARYLELGTVWFIREIEIEYQQAVRFGDAIEVTTWVGDFRRVRSRRYYELRSVNTGALAVRASADWVYIDRERQLPVHVPDEMVAAFAPDPADRATQGDRREPFPEPPPRPAGAYTERRVVEWRDIDVQRHVNNANYLSFMEESSVKAAAALGWPFQRMEAEGWGIMARGHRIEYRLQAALGDVLDVTTYLAEPRRSTIYRIYAIHRASDQALVAQARSQFMCVNLVTGGLMRFPEDAMRDFAVSVAEPAKNPS